MSKDTAMCGEMLLGVDFGSGGAKSTLISVKGEVLATCFKEYPTYYPELYYAEQNPDDWWKALVESIAELVEENSLNPYQLLAISVDAPTHNAVLLDKDKKVLRNAIFWTDQRSSSYARELDEKYGELILEQAFHRPGTIWTLPQLLWIKRQQPEIWNKIRYIIFEKDYIRYLMTGNLATDNIEAMGSMLFDARKNSWSTELCNLIDLPVEFLPEIKLPFEIAGGLTKTAAKILNLREGMPVIVGTTDTALEIFGAGAVNPGQATVKLATAGRICVITERAAPHEYLINYPHVVPGKWYPGTATKSCASSYRWFRDVFGEKETELEMLGGKSSYYHLDILAASAPPGSDGLFFHPYLTGELTPYNNSNLRASFTGATMKHTKAHFARAVLEGVAFSLRDCLEVIRQCGFELEDIRLIGGGSGSPLWSQIVSDVMGISLTKPSTADSSFGGAMLAGIGAGVFSDFDDAVDKCVKLKENVEPDMIRHEHYEKLFQVYREIEKGLEVAYEKLTMLKN